MNNICAVVVTYNRIELLKELINSLRSQTIKLEKIIIVNNGSLDYTGNWLAQQKDLYVIEQENTGSSGGQYTGIKSAYELNMEWIWVMDDDVIPELNCLEKLIQKISYNRIHAPLRYSNENIPYLNDVKYFNLTNPFKSLWQGILTNKDIVEEYISAEGITFEGPIFHRSLIEKIGLPEKNFFIYGDDTEFFIRAKKSGFDIYIVRDAKSHRKLPVSDLREKFDWKHYYIIRNIIAIDVIHGNLAVRLFRPIGYFIKWLFRCHNTDNLKITFKAFIDGYFYKSK
jgi:GT2 family glycosyltransferase